jgi:NadR type nicotinamide-nucleotide adenylyltransferase
MKKVVVIGPESTGKSTLCEQLALHYNTSWCPEFARKYLLTHGTTYSYDDLLTIAKGQIDLEEKTILQAKNDIVFIDTDMYVMKVWGEFVYGQCHAWILNEIVKKKYDLYLLCNIDLPWQKDTLREYPDLISRQKLYSMYKDIMINQSVPWVDISGMEETRFDKAIEGISKFSTFL